MSEDISQAILALPTVKQTIDQNQLRTKKSLGQHFLLDWNLLLKIARQVKQPETKHIVEIGPGPGGLTRALLFNGAKSINAIEHDDRCMEALQPLVQASAGRLNLHNADALKVNELDVLQSSHSNAASYYVVSNLPYNIGTELLIKWLHKLDEVEGMTLMFQKEVAKRVAAAPGGKDYGRLSILSQFLCDVTYHFDVPAEAFSPPPKVVSAVITLIPKEKPAYPIPLKTLEAFTQQVFSQRRKMLRASLKHINPDAESIIASVGIKPTARPEELDLISICKLAEAFKENLASQDEA